MVRRMILALIVSVVAAATAFAQQGWYVRVSGSGYSTPDSVGTGYMVSIGGGYRFNQYFAAGAGVGFAQYVIEVEDEEGNAEDLNVYEIPAYIGARVYILPDSAVCPFVEAGPAAYFVKVEGEDWTNSWGAYLEGGVRFRVGRYGGVDLWVRYSVPDVEDTEQYRITYGLGGSFAGR